MGTKNQSGGAHGKIHVSHSQHKWDDIKISLHKCLVYLLSLNKNHGTDNNCSTSNSTSK